MSNAATPSSAAARTARVVGEVEAALRGRRLGRAVSVAQDALQEGLEHPLLFNLAAHALEEENRFDEAFALLERAARLAPRDPLVLNAIGLNLIKQDRRDQAIRAFDAAISIDPRFAQAWCNKGQALHLFGRFDAAREHFEQALRLVPDYADAAAGLATLAVRQGEIAEARARAAEALKTEPGHSAAETALAHADFADREFQAVIARVSALLQKPELAPRDRPGVQALLGDALDALDRRDEAFAAYEAAAADTRAMGAPRFGPGAPGDALARARSLLAGFSAIPAQAWASPDLTDPGEARTHVFLLGFPRSGTTLLEEILAAHPEVVTLSERHALADSEAEFMMSADAIQRLPGLKGEELKLYRDAYWGRIRAMATDPRRRIFVDKMPMASMDLPLIAALFPKAKVLFALRDPRDVVLSCFRRPFALNPAMHQFTTLEGAARFYDAVMQLVRLYRERLPIDLREIRYEAVVEDFEGEIRAACGFIGANWDEAMRDFAGSARARPILTPSARQVRQGLYRQGMGQWRRYERQLGPVMPILQPWIEAFGYEAS